MRSSGDVIRLENGFLRMSPTPITIPISTLTVALGLVRMEFMFGIKNMCIWNTERCLDHRYQWRTTLYNDKGLLLCISTEVRVNKGQQAMRVPPPQYQDHTSLTSPSILRSIEFTDFRSGIKLLNSEMTQFTLICKIKFLLLNEMEA